MTWLGHSMALHLTLPCRTLQPLLWREDGRQLHHHLRFFPSPLPWDCWAGGPLLLPTPCLIWVGTRACWATSDRGKERDGRGRAAVCGEHDTQLTTFPHLIRQAVGKTGSRDFSSRASAFSHSVATFRRIWRTASRSSCRQRQREGGRRRLRTWRNEMKNDDKAVAQWT